MRPSEFIKKWAWVLNAVYNDDWGDPGSGGTKADFKKDFNEMIKPLIEKEKNDRKIALAKLTEEEKKLLNITLNEE